MLNLVWPGLLVLWPKSWIPLIVFCWITRPHPVYGQRVKCFDVLCCSHVFFIAGKISYVGHVSNCQYYSEQKRTYCGHRFVLYSCQIGPSPCNAFLIHQHRILHSKSITLCLSETHKRKTKFKLGQRRTNVYQDMTGVENTNHIQKNLKCQKGKETLELHWSISKPDFFFLSYLSVTTHFECHFFSCVLLWKICFSLWPLWVASGIGNLKVVNISVQFNGGFPTSPVGCGCILFTLDE